MLFHPHQLQSIARYGVLTRASMGVQVRASLLLGAVIVATMAAITASSMMRLGLFQYRMESRRVARAQAWLHAENALLEGVMRVAETADGTDPQGSFTLADGNLFRAYDADGLARMDGAWMEIAADPTGRPNNFTVTASATVDGVTQTLRADVVRTPPSEVFDYVYFLNNWGWWWGRTITGQGPSRTNWDFDFRYNPTANGLIAANGEISSDGVQIDPFASGFPFSGRAAQDPLNYIRTGLDRLKMPNLRDLGYYEDKAREDSGTISVGGAVVVNAVHNSVPGKPGLYLRGTAAAPIVVDGPVVIPGDLIISGVVTGQGTLYVGGNMYVPEDLTNLNSPNFTTPPSLMEPDDRDAWVEDAVTSGRDLVAYAVRKSIYVGQVNTTDFRNVVWADNRTGLKTVGDESELGRDGIQGTDDDGVAWADTDGDGVADSAAYDANGNGVIDPAFDYDRDIRLTNTRLGRISGYPMNGANPVDYNSLSRNNIATLQGVFYTNEAIGLRVNSHLQIIGSLICQHEKIVFGRSLSMIYDERLHSRYQSALFGGSSNRFVDLGLPDVERVRIIRRQQIPSEE